jgi:hypothetical protein
MCSRDNYIKKVLSSKKKIRILLLFGVKKGPGPASALTIQAKSRHYKNVDEVLQDGR